MDIQWDKAREELYTPAESHELARHEITDVKQILKVSGVI